MTRRDAIKLAIAGALSPLLSLLPERVPDLTDASADLPKIKKALNTGPERASQMFRVQTMGIRNETGRGAAYQFPGGEPVWIEPGEVGIITGPLPVQKEAGK